MKPLLKILSFLFLLLVAQVASGASTNENPSVDNLLVSNSSVTSAEDFGTKTKIDSSISFLTFNIHYYVWDTGATNLVAQIESLLGRTFEAGTQEVVTSTMSASGLSTTEGAVILDIAEKVTFEFYEATWQIYPCDNESCSSGDAQSVIGSGFTIGDVPRHNYHHYAGNIVVKYRVIPISDSSENSCTYGSETVAHGDSRVFYNTASAPMCLLISLSRQCVDGVWAGDSHYQYMSCVDTTPPNPAPTPVGSCTVNGTVVPHGTSRLFFNAAQAISCTTQVRACNNGVIDGDSTYRYSTCTPLWWALSSREDADIYTRAATQSSDSSIRLRGEVDLNDWNGAKVYFEWGNSSTSLAYQTPEQYQRRSGSFDYLLAKPDAGENYYYQAVAEDNDGDREYGDIRSFTADGEQSESLKVDTLAATVVDEDSARINGSVSGKDKVRVWFTISDKRETPRCTAVKHTVGEGHAENNTSFSKVMTNLEVDTTYYYQACAEDSNGDTRAGTVASFITRKEGLVVVSASPSEISSTGARLNAQVGGDGKAVCFFKYGPTSALGNATTMELVDLDDTNVCSAYLSSLEQDTKYFYQAVLKQNGQTQYAAVRSFRTRVAVNTNPVATNPVETTPAPTSTVVTEEESTEALNITKSVSAQNDPRFNEETTVRPGDTLFYRVQVSNNTDEDVQDVVVVDRIPSELELDSDRGSDDNEDKQLSWEITLKAGESRTFTTELRVREDAPEGDEISSFATVYYVDVEKQSNEVVVRVQGANSSSNSKEGDGANQTASISGAGVLPTDLTGWALLLLIIVAIAFFVSRMIALHNEQQAELAALKALKLKAKK